MDRLLTIKEASERTTIPVPTLRYHRHVGTGPSFFKLNGKIVIKESDLEAWIEEQYAASASPTQQPAPAVTPPPRRRAPARSVPAPAQR